MMDYRSAVLSSQSIRSAYSEYESGLVKACPQYGVPNSLSKLGEANLLAIADYMSDDVHRLFSLQILMLLRSIVLGDVRFISLLGHSNMHNAFFNIETFEVVIYQEEPGAVSRASDLSTLQNLIVFCKYIIQKAETPMQKLSRDATGDVLSYTKLEEDLNKLCTDPSATSDEVMQWLATLLQLFQRCLPEDATLSASSGGISTILFQYRFHQKEAAHEAGTLELIRRRKQGK